MIVSMMAVRTPTAAEASPPLQGEGQGEDGVATVGKLLCLLLFVAARLSGSGSLLFILIAARLSGSRLLCLRLLFLIAARLRRGLLLSFLVTARLRLRLLHLRTMVATRSCAFIRPDRQGTGNR